MQARPTSAQLPGLGGRTAVPPQWLLPVASTAGGAPGAGAAAGAASSAAPTAPLAGGVAELETTGTEGLLGGLRRLARRSAPTQALRPCSANVSARRDLLAGSSLCTRANARLEGLEDWVDNIDCAARAKTMTRDSETSEKNREAIARFQELLEAVDVAMGVSLDPDSVIPEKPLHAGSLIVQEFAPLEHRFFVVPLPPRTAEVVVSAARVGGGAPAAIYASAATGARPSKSDFELEAEAGELSYRHEVEPGRGMLHLCIASGEDTCEFRIRCVFRRPAEQEAVPGSYSLRRRIQERLAHLREAPEELKALVTAARKHQRCKQREMRKVKDFAAIHRTQVSAQRPSRAQAHQLQAISQKATKRSVVARRREEIEQESTARALLWTHKEDDWQRERKGQAWRHDQMVLRPEQWLERLLVVAYAERLRGEFLRAKAVREWAQKEANAASMIQRSFRRWWTLRRKWHVRSHAVKLRCALQAFCRHARVAVVSVAQPRVAWLLRTHGLSMESPSTCSVIKEFVSHIKRAQRAYRRNVRVRRARVEALTPRFTAAAALAAWEAAEAASGLGAPAAGPGPGPRSTRDGSGARPPLWDSAHAARAGSGTGLGGAAPRRGRGAVEEPEPRAAAAAPRASGSARAAPQGAPAFVRELRASRGQEPEEPLPGWLRRQVLQRHVLEMQRAYPERLRRFLDLKRELQVEQELQRMGLGQPSARLAALRKPPRAVELARLPALYTETYDAFLRGGFKEEQHLRKCILGKLLRLWSRIARRINVPGDGALMRLISFSPAAPCPAFPRALPLQASPSSRDTGCDRNEAAVTP